MVRFKQSQRLAIRWDRRFYQQCPGNSSAHKRATVVADQLSRSYPNGGFSRDQIELTIIDVAGVADVVVELGK